MRPFLVLALPRSRTAWLANWLTWGRVRCEHDVSEDATGLEWAPESAAAEICKSILLQGNLPHCVFAGAADTGAAIYLEQILDFLCPARSASRSDAGGEPRIVVIERDPREVCRSLRNLGFPLPEEPVKFLSDKLAIASRMPGTLTVKFADLDSECACRAILGHVAPGEPFDRARWAMLRDFNVQLTSRALARQARQIEI